MSNKKKEQDTTTPENTGQEVLEQEEKDVETGESTAVEEQESRIRELEQELATVKDALLRKAAELENVRKRVQRERVNIFEEAKASALEDFLPVNDDLLRTLDASEGTKVEDSFLEGVKLVSEKFREVLAKHGVERIDQTGVPFDVNLHDALLRQPAPDDKTPSDTVIQILERGYRMGNKTIRHAKVIVSE